MLYSPLASPSPLSAAGSKKKMQQQHSLPLPQPVLYEPDALPIVSVAFSRAPSHALAAAQGQHHQLLVVPVWEAAPTKSGAEQLLTEQAHLGQLDKATGGALAAALDLHAFSGKKVRQMLRHAWVGRATALPLMPFVCP
jgi:hypothetical protein